MVFQNGLESETSIGNFIGGLILIIPQIGKRIKEWAYVAFGITYISAFIVHMAVDGIVPMSFAPLVTLRDIDCIVRVLSQNTSTIIFKKTTHRCRFLIRIYAYNQFARYAMKSTAPTSPRSFWTLGENRDNDNCSNNLPQ